MKSHLVKLVFQLDWETIRTRKGILHGNASVELSQTIIFTKFEKKDDNLVSKAEPNVSVADSPVLQEPEVL